MLSRFAAAFALAATIVVSFAAAAKPFSDLGVDQAKTQAQDDGRILVVMGTAEWCGPCKRMKRTTFADPKIIDWFEDYGLAIQVDVDDQPLDARMLRIESMPTLIAFYDGEEIGRMVGNRGTDQFHNWLEDFREQYMPDGPSTGGGSVDPMARLASRAETGGMTEKLAYADALIEAGEHAAAIEPLTAILAEGHGTAMSITERLDEIASDRARTNDLRKAAGKLARSASITPRFDADKTAAWFALSSSVDKGRLVVQWYKRNERNPRAEPYIASVRGPLVHALVRVEQYELAAEALGEPDTYVDGVFQAATGTPGADCCWPVALETHFMQEALALAYTALLAADREEDAMAVAERALAVSDTAEMRRALIRVASAAGLSHEKHREWSSEASEMD